MPLTCGRAPTLRGHCWTSGPPLSHVPLPLAQKDRLLKAPRLYPAPPPQGAQQLSLPLPPSLFCFPSVLHSSKNVLGKGPSSHSLSGLHDGGQPEANQAQSLRLQGQVFNGRVLDIAKKLGRFVGSGSQGPFWRANPTELWESGLLPDQKIS